MSKLTKWGKRRSYAPYNIGEQMIPPDDIKMLSLTNDTIQILVHRMIPDDTDYYQMIPDTI